MIDFKEKRLHEIRLWAWAATVLPITSLAGLFFIWLFGTDSAYAAAMIMGATTMFLMAVVWWWWAIYTIRNVIVTWARTNEDLVHVTKDVQEIKTAVIDLKKK